MKNLIKPMLLVFILMIFGINTAYSAQKDVLLKTTSTWDKAEFKNLKMKKPEVTVLKITINKGEALPVHKHDLINIVYVKQGTLTVITDKKEELQL